MRCGRDGGPDHAATRKSGRDRDHCLNVRFVHGAIGAMGRTIQSAEQWRKRAEEMRAIADELAALPAAQVELVRIADQYERRALRAETAPLR
jgi:hypothetical protein